MTVNDKELRQNAEIKAKDYLENDSQYRMGYITAEQPNPITRNLSKVCSDDPAEGVKLLFSVDRDMAGRAEETLGGDEFRVFADTIRSTIKNGGRVIFSGCGSTGRICMRLESSWREAIDTLSDEKYSEYKERIGYIQTGGDYAVIRAVESFEDSAPLGRAQAMDWHLTEKDLLVGITATAETTSILGTAAGALEQGAKVYMLVCSDPLPLMEKMERVREIYSHKNCHYLLLPCGPFAVTGSSRMQSSTFEQLCCAAALEGALYDITGRTDSFAGYPQMGRAFKELTDQLLSEQAVSAVTSAVLDETEIYKKSGLMTYFADDCLLDVLTDTTERAPTFMTPPFCSTAMVGAEQSWAFVKNPFCSTSEAWTKCFGREPRCMEWEKERYISVGFSDEATEKMPDIGRSALLCFEIGNERDEKREQTPSRALWIGREAAPECFTAQTKGYGSVGQLTLRQMGVSFADTYMDIFYHLCIKLTLNALSTATMALMGRITGNWMTCLAMSNKKLIDRSARIVSDVCGVSYETALAENFYSAALCEAKNINRSPAQETIKRLSKGEIV